MGKTFEVLVVDDDESAARMIAYVLDHRLACNVRVATGGAQAIEMVTETRPHAVLMDLHMPGISGVAAHEVMTRLFSNGARPRMVAMTGAVDQRTRELVGSQGFDDFLAKPLDWDRLIVSLTAKAPLHAD